LRERHLSNRGSRHRFSANHSILLCGMAWNFFATEKPCKVLRLRDENAFPIL